MATAGGACPTFAGGVEAACEVLLDLDLQRPLLLLRRTVLATGVSFGITTGSINDNFEGVATGWWWWWLWALRISWGVVSADTESARETKTKHLLMEGMVIKKSVKWKFDEDKGKRKNVEPLGGRLARKEGPSNKPRSSERERAQRCDEETKKEQTAFYSRCHVVQIVQSPCPGYAASFYMFMSNT